MTELTNYLHPEAKRTNIPTAENQALVPDDDRAPRTLLYPRNRDLDPQLVWTGKDVENRNDLEVAAPPVYIQEKIHPQSLINNLKRRTPRPGGAPQIDLFSDFDGPIDEEAKTEFYEHDQNWSNRMILGDSLLVMGSLAEREALRGKVQMIYLDPPYGIKFSSNWQPAVNDRDSNTQTDKTVSREPEVVRAFRDTWGEGISSYLSYLRDRFVLSRDLLTESGSIFVQMSMDNAHLVCSLLDEVFGRDNQIGIIPFRKKTMPFGTNYIEQMADVLLWYGKNKADSAGRPATKYRSLYRSLSEEPDSNFRFVEEEGGQRRPLEKDERDRWDQSFGSLYRLKSLEPSGPMESGRFRPDFRGVSYDFPRNGYAAPPEGLDRLAKAGRIEPLGRYLNYLLFKRDTGNLTALTAPWFDTAGPSDKTYVVQTSRSVVERCMLMTTDPGDLVLDPTCGSGTTAFVAEQWGRRWIAIDTSRVALALARTRLMAAKYDWYLPRDSVEGAAKESQLTGKLAGVPASDHRPDLRQGFVYERAPRITLKSIAKNIEVDVIWDKFQERLEPPRLALNAALDTAWQEWEIPRDPDAAWTAAAKADHAAWWAARRERQAEIDASIARGAEVEMLYDRPYKAKGVVRVAGPFTVESLSPHRVLPLEEDPVLLEALGGEGPSSCAAKAAPPSPSRGEGLSGQTDFAQVVYENLKAAGVQNSKKGEAIKFEWLKPFASRKGYVAFEGRYLENETEKRAAVAVGPEYDTVGYEFVRNAAREAADLFDTLIVCGFAFAPEVDESRLNFGGLTVLKAGMNQDLRMGDKLKATGAGNLFVVFGEPDIAIEEAEDDMIRIRIKGVDIFDPTSGEVRSSDDPAEDIACWFIDDDYDEESFFVRQAYFLGRDPYESLKRALKAEIDEAAWAELNSTVSCAFPRPQRGRVCVKVINHFGDEVQKVFDV